VATDGVLRVSIHDNGTTSGVTPEVDTRGRGIGLSNTQARLAAMYGERARLAVASAPGDGTTVTLTVPIGA
jgi:sensor histidine kinase YesM